MAKHNRVLISEYSMPDDFTCLWEQPMKITYDNSHGTQTHMEHIERLYTIE